MQNITKPTETKHSPEIPERRSLKTSVVMKSPTKPGDLDIFLRRKKEVSIKKTNG